MVRSHMKSREGNSSMVRFFISKCQCSQILKSNDKCLTLCLHIAVNDEEVNTLQVLDGYY